MTGHRDYRMPIHASSIVFIDANVTEYHEFINVIQPTIAAYILPKTVDGIGYIT
ncbi:MAG: DUF4347 domain-containing protein, partial [Symploca sp. SIO2B6]|nr:DUF4347 domain-containing protein [Symploca sp. SIO2B6]